MRVSLTSVWGIVVVGEGGAMSCRPTYEPPDPPPITPNQPAGHSVGRLREATVGGDLRLETGALSRGEVVHAGIVGVVHVVVETIDPTA